MFPTNKYRLPVLNSSEENKPVPPKSRPGYYRLNVVSGISNGRSGCSRDRQRPISEGGRPALPCLEHSGCRNINYLLWWGVGRLFSTTSHHIRCNLYKGRCSELIISTFLEVTATLSTNRPATHHTTENVRTEHGIFLQLQQLQWKSN